MNEWIADFFATFRWQDAVDIAVVAYFTYRVMLFFVGTRGMTLVRGLLVIAAVGAMTRALDLRTVSWLLGYILSAFLIAMPIVFQPELRRFLEEIGRGRLLSRTLDSDNQGKRNAEEVTQAVLYLKKNKIGALIVFQKHTGLKDICRSGVPVRSDITRQLLISIFWYGTPLHDGAVVLDQNKIVAAACYLPLTESKEMSQWAGTRHRAAAGLTEVSDAMVLVVSEERGEVSLAIHGHISTKPLTDDQVALVVQKYFSPYDKNATFFERIKLAVVQAWRKS